MSGAAPAGGQGPSYSWPKSKSFSTCVPKRLPATPAPSGNSFTLPAMLYMPQWVKLAVVSNRTTTNERVSGGASVQNSSGDWSPPASPLAVHVFTPLDWLFRIIERGGVPSLGHGG